MLKPSISKKHQSSWLGRRGPKRSVTGSFRINQDGPSCVLQDNKQSRFQMSTAHQHYHRNHLHVEEMRLARARVSLKIGRVIAWSLSLPTSSDLIFYHLSALDYPHTGSWHISISLFDLYESGLFCGKKVYKPSLALSILWHNKSQREREKEISPEPNAICNS